MDKIKGFAKMCFKESSDIKAWHHLEESLKTTSWGLRRDKPSTGIKAEAMVKAEVKGQFENGDEKQLKKLKFIGSLLQSLSFVALLFSPLWPDSRDKEISCGICMLGLR